MNLVLQRVYEHNAPDRITAATVSSTKGEAAMRFAFPMGYVAP
jgi:hypothetical protein